MGSSITTCQRTLSQSLWVNSNEQGWVNFRERQRIDKLAARFGAKEVTLVGDRGMIKSEQIELLAKKGYSYITAITKPQIEGLAQVWCIADGLV
ncbi:MAG: hypothetical protein IPH35_03885 [Rhodoferax sp.]|nr:hypothetical protein [Rhodoferax sp.]